MQRSGATEHGAHFAPAGAWSGLYRPEHEHDSCGTGFVANVNGQRSHTVLALAVQSVTNLTHRGAVDADAQTGDGAGVMTQLPYRLLQRELARLGFRDVPPQAIAVAVVFLPREGDVLQQRCREAAERAARAEGLTVFGWRTVPVEPGALGDAGRRTRPQIEQLLLGGPAGVDADELERRCYLARKAVERWAAEEGVSDLYLPSWSARTVVYKGLVVAHQLPKFYLDLVDPDYDTALAVFHQRYSTNTFPSWVLAQPFRLIAHNGEINTLAGNRNWMAAREPSLASSVWGERMRDLMPVLHSDGSDTASLDKAVELLARSGRDALHALMMLIPEAWENMPLMAEDRRAFYEFHACLTEPWDGPASIAFSDGRWVGATLDRNGLRPARYVVTDSGLVVMGSEVGMVPIEASSVVEKGRLGPGQMVAVDTVEGRLYKNDELKDAAARRRPYRTWVQRQSLHLDDYIADLREQLPQHPTADLQRLEAAFGYTGEELQFILRPMAVDGKEPIGAMGDDTALAVFASRPRLLYAYFKQKFAQVTNPPIDPIREELVMSLDTYLGRRHSLLEEREGHARLVHLNSPLMADEELEALRRIAEPAFHAVTIPVLFRASDGPEGMRAAADRICRAAENAVDDGATILILSDRGVDAERAAIPMLVAVGAVHNHLIRAGKRMQASVIAETGEARDVHQAAVLIGFGASAVNPYLAFQAIADLEQQGDLKDVPLAKAVENYEKAMDAGLLKIMSKMGISTVTGYHGAQIFEAIGVGRELLDLAFTGLVSRVGGIGLEELAEDVLRRHEIAFSGEEPPGLDDGSFYRFRREGEYHAFNPDVIKAAHRYGESGAWDDYLAYTQLVQSRPPILLRDLLEFRPAGDPVPLEEVEPAEAIMRRFAGAAMSLGALSPEAHEAVAIGMNSIGARSNTGEGGEPSGRYKPYPDGRDANSRIKQVASARFGVTPGYLAAAEQLEIKMAQGSKPGEGGQLPGHKVSTQIAALRHTLPGTPLISPPPHHDIYSIEDLAQLIYDLKQVNPRAFITVKLVAEEGVGTIAAGVAKGYADIIHIAGHDGGTGASPLSSIKMAGAPWELGLSETQQVLVQNDLRGRVRLRTDGGLKTGRDVVVAALLGAEEYGFGTALAVAVGCKMARQCHLNTCPVGVATQREDLRARFNGRPEQVATFLRGVAEEVRQILASLGLRSLDEAVGRVDLLAPAAIGEHPRARLLDFSRILTEPGDPSRPRKSVRARNDRVEQQLDERIIADAMRALEGSESLQLRYPVRNTNRSVGARLAGEIAHRYGDAGLPSTTLEVEFEGSAGQSFGAFCIRGLRLTLVGEANDYVAKGMGGGEVVVLPPADASFRSHENVIVGNTVLYGATGGTLFVGGRAGERFAVRNSGAKAVVEGCGDHGCEYMTEGVVVILGEVGRNFGAGMSNGVAYVFDENRELPKKLNPELVGLAQVTHDADIEILKTLVERHYERTGSKRAKRILARWDEMLPLFWKVAPHFALTEEGPMKVVMRHLESLKASVP